jgi:hypothetical protein
MAKSRTAYLRDSAARLAKLIELDAPGCIIHNEVYMLVRFCADWLQEQADKQVTTSKPKRRQAKGQNGQQAP